MSSLPPDSCHRCKTLGRGCKMLLDGREALPVPLELHICSVMKCQVWKSVWIGAISICSAVCTAPGTRTVQSSLKWSFAHRQEGLPGNGAGLVVCHGTGVPGLRGYLASPDKVPLGWREGLLSLGAGQSRAASLGTGSPWFKDSLSRENKLIGRTEVFFF